MKNREKNTCMRFHPLFLEDFLTFHFCFFMIYYLKIQSFGKVEENECSEGRNKGMSLLLRQGVLPAFTWWFRNMPKLWGNWKTERIKITKLPPYMMRSIFLSFFPPVILLTKNACF